MEDKDLLMLLLLAISLFGFGYVIAKLNSMEADMRDLRRREEIITAIASGNGDSLQSSARIPLGLMM